MNLDNCQTFDRRGRELELAARPLLVLTCSHAQETITTKPKQKNHLHNFLYKTFRASGFPVSGFSCEIGSL